MVDIYIPLSTAALSYCSKTNAAHCQHLMELNFCVHILTKMMWTYLCPKLCVLLPKIKTLCITHWAEKKVLCQIETKGCLGKISFKKLMGM